MKMFKILILTLIIVSCAPIHVNYDFEKGIDFASYKTYNYYGDMQTSLSELDTKRMLDILDATMKSKGLSLSDDPDFLINIQSREFQESQRSSVGVGVGGGGRNVGGGISIGLPLGQANINRQIIIDFADENKNGLFWQAVSESYFNPNGSPQSRTERLNAIITKMLSQYPPK